MSNNYMMIMILNNGGYFGIRKAIGKTVKARIGDEGGVFVKGSELWKAGAEKFAFRKNGEYCFCDGDYRIVKGVE